MPLPISAINHLSICTKRLPESRAFYRDVLGFREVERPNFDFAGAWLLNYGLMIHIIAGNAAGEPTPEINTRGPHLALHADDLPAVEKLLMERGIDFRKNEVPGRAIKQLFFQDPDGYHIEVGTYPPSPPFLP